MCSVVQCVGQEVLEEKYGRREKNMGPIALHSLHRTQKVLVSSASCTHQWVLEGMREEPIRCGTDLSCGLVVLWSCGLVVLWSCGLT